MKKIIKRVKAKPKWIILALIVLDVVYASAIALQETVDFLPFDEEVNRYLKFCILMIVAIGNGYILRINKTRNA